MKNAFPNFSPISVNRFLSESLPEATEFLNRCVMNSTSLLKLKRHQQEFIQALKWKPTSFKTGNVENKHVMSTVVQLWPLYEIHALSTELAVMRDFATSLASEEVDGSLVLDARLKACLEFLKQCGVSDASSVMPLSLMCGLDFEVCYITVQSSVNVIYPGFNDQGLIYS